MVDCLDYIALFCIPTQFSRALDCFKAIVQRLDSDWPANILSGSHFRAQENELMSPDSVCTISAGPAWHDTSHIQVCHMRSGDHTK